MGIFTPGDSDTCCSWRENPDVDSKLEGSRDLFILFTNLSHEPELDVALGWGWKVEEDGAGSMWAQNLEPGWSSGTSCFQGSSASPKEVTCGRTD